MQIADLEGLKVHYRDEGDPEGPAIVFANSLGTDLRMWDKILPLLPKGLRIVRYDKRGHGLTDCPPGPYAMGQLVTDAERLLDHLGVRESLFVGLSVGGLIAQGLAVKRPDLMRAMVLSNTGAKIGTHEMWQQRIDAIRQGGIEAISGAILERWFSKTFRGRDEFAGWRNMLVRQPAEGYVGVATAIAGTDFYTTTAALSLPTLAIAGSEDGATPPDLVRETAALIEGSRFELMRGPGHLPCVEAPDAYAGLLTDFLAETGHV